MKPGVFICWLLLPLWLLGQTPRIDNLRRIIPLLKDSARIDSILELSVQYTGQYVRDSAEYYATIAYNQSAAIYYIHGMAEALSLQGFNAIHFYNDFVKAKALDSASIDWYKKTTNNRGLPSAETHLAFACFSQGKYDEALEIARESYSLYKSNRDTTGTVDALGLIAQIHIKRGEFDKGFDAVKEGILLSSKSGDSARIKSFLISFGELCMAIEYYSQALTYYKSVYDNFTQEDSLYQVADENFTWVKMEYAEIFAHLKMFDSAIRRYNLFDTAKMPEKDLRIWLVSKGEYYMQTGDFNKALPLLSRGLAIHLKLNDLNEVIRAVIDMANTYYILHNENQALLFAREGLRLGLQTRARQVMRDAYKVLYSVHDGRHETDSAYFYYQKYIQAKDLVTDDQTRGKFAAYDYENKIELLNNDKLNNQQKLNMQGKLLRNETLLRNILIIFAFTILAVSFLLLVNIFLKRRNEKLRNQNIQRELQHKTIDMELRALRAQMNPHFIFNCLNSINRFIMKNESQAASDFLTQFSRLIRLVLNNSKKAWITLDEEINMLRLYIDMEKLRFGDAFDYELNCGENMDPSDLFIPPLLLQPFVENAIWHGLMHRKTNGLVTISFSVENNILHCCIVDNGVGRSAAREADSKSSQNHKSMGIQITRERLMLINGSMDGDKVVDFDIEDLFNASGEASGTKVNLKIKFHRDIMTEENSYSFTKIAENDQVNNH